MARMADDVAAIRAHLGKINPSVFDGVILGPIRGRFEDVLHSQVSNAVNAQTNAWQAGSEISSTAAVYQQTDQAQSAAFDSKLADTKEYSWNEVKESTDKFGPAYTDVNNPQGRLIEPPDYDHEMSWSPSLLTDIGSISSAIRAMIKAIIQVDPLQKVEEAIAGNWPAVRQISDRFNNAAWAFRDCADNIANCQSSSEQDWTGHAADSARNYLGQLADGFSGEYQRNEYLADQIKDLSESAMETINTLVDIASDWLNAKLMPALASIGIAGLTEEVPLVDIVTDVFAGYKVYEAVQAGVEVYEKATAINNIAEDLMNAFNLSQSGRLEVPTVDAPPMPTSPWVSPVAG